MRAFILIAVFVLTVLALPAPAFADAAPPKAEVKTASRAGSGCPASQTAHAELSPDLSSLKVDLPEQTAEIAGKGGGTFARVNCDAVITITHSPGWQVTPASASVELIAHLAGGANGEVTYKAYQQGNAQTSSANVPLNPGDTRPHTEELKLTEAWSACGSTATVVEGTALKLRGGDGPSKLLVRTDKLLLRWRECKP